MICDLRNGLRLVRQIQLLVIRLQVSVTYLLGVQVLYGQDHLEEVHTMVKPGSKLCGLTKKVFRLIPPYVGEISLFLLKKYLNVLQGFYRVTALNNRFKTLILTSTASRAIV